MSVGKIIDLRWMENYRKPNREKKPRAAKKFRCRGIGDAAVALGVTPTHLWYVLRGIRRSSRIEASDFYRRTMKARAEFQRQK